MGKDITLTASDGFELGGYRADPAEKPKAAIVVIQEIFGVNHHIRSVCDRLAAEGYVAVAPAIFDRTEPDFQCGYSPDEIATARKFIADPDWAAMLRDTQAAIDAVKDVGPVGIIGFCLGGSIAYAAATRLSGLSAAVGYYGGAVVRFADDKPNVPTQLHFGGNDAGIPLADVETIRGKRPEVEIFVYPGAAHGFGCDERASYDKPSADLAGKASTVLSSSNKALGTSLTTEGAKIQDDQDSLFVAGMLAYFDGTKATVQAAKLVPDLAKELGGFQPPKDHGENATSPVGDHAADQRPDAGCGHLAQAVEEHSRDHGGGNNDPAIVAAIGPGDALSERLHPGAECAQNHQCGAPQYPAEHRLLTGHRHSLLPLWDSIVSPGPLRSTRKADATRGAGRDSGR